MPRGKNIPKDAEIKQGEQVKLSMVVDKETRSNLEKVSATLYNEFGYIPTQGQTIKYLVDEYLN